MTQFFTVAQVAQQLGCSTDLVRAHITSGRLEAINVGTRSTKEYRIEEAWLQAFVKSSSVVSKPCVKREPRRKTPLVRKSKWIRDLNCG